MKKIVQGIVLAGLFAVMQPVKASEDNELTQKIGQNAGTIGAIAAVSVLGPAFMSWLAKPTSKNLFSIANQLDIEVKNVEYYLKKNNIQKNPFPSRSIINLISEIDNITKEESTYNRIFKRLTNETINTDNKTLIALSDRTNADNNRKELTITIKTDELKDIIQKIRSRAEKRKETEDSTWWKRMWSGKNKTMDDKK